MSQDHAPRWRRETLEESISLMKLDHRSLATSSPGTLECLAFLLDISAR
jgi:hypothetical protein